MKSTNLIIPLVIFPFDVMVSIAESDEQLTKYVKKHVLAEDFDQLHKDGVLTMEKSCDGRTVNTAVGHATVIRLKKYPKTPKDHGVLAHEIFHAASFILWRMGVHLDIEKTDEVYAYLIGYLTEQIYKHI